MGNAERQFQPGVSLRKSGEEQVAWNLLLEKTVTVAEESLYPLRKLMGVAGVAAAGILSGRISKAIRSGRIRTCSRRKPDLVWNESVAVDPPRSDQQPEVKGLANLTGLIPCITCIEISACWGGFLNHSIFVSPASVTR